MKLFTFKYDENCYRLTLFGMFQVIFWDFRSLHMGFGTAEGEFLKFVYVDLGPLEFRIYG